MKLLLLPTLLFPVLVFAQKPATAVSNSNYYLDCKGDAEKNCLPLHSYDATSIKCLEKKLTAITPACARSLNQTKSFLQKAGAAPLSYSDKGNYTSEQRLSLVMIPANYSLPATKPSFVKFCGPDGDKYCAQFPKASTDRALCLKERFLSGVNLSQNCFTPFKQYVNWIEKSISDHPECVAEYNQFCRQENTGDGINDCMTAHFASLSPRCAEMIKSLRPVVLKDKAAKAAAAKAAAKATPTK